MLTDFNKKMQLLWLPEKVKIPLPQDPLRSPCIEILYTQIPHHNRTTTYQGQLHNSSPMRFSAAILCVMENFHYFLLINWANAWFYTSPHPWVPCPCVPEFLHPWVLTLLSPWLMSQSPHPRPPLSEKQSMIIHQAVKVHYLDIYDRLSTC